MVAESSVTEGVGKRRGFYKSAFGEQGRVIGSCLDRHPRKGALKKKKTRQREEHTSYDS